MKKLVLQEKILEDVKSKPFLLAQIATIMGIRTAYLLRLIRENDERLTQASVINLIKETLNVSKDSELFTSQAVAA